jgi:hypothetical protein
MGLGDTFVAAQAVGTIARFFAEAAEKAAQDKKTYAEKLEGAKGDEIFKYILLINVSAMEGYVAQTRIQAEQSFRLSRIVASVGFAILGIGILLAAGLTVVGRPTIEAANLTTIAGVLTEFISGVFFYLYSRTLQQINRFHDKLIVMQQTSMGYLATGLVSDREKGDHARIELAKTAMFFPEQRDTKKDT